MSHRTSEFFEPKTFRRELDDLMRRNRDPELHEVLWSYIGGQIDRRQLRRNRVYTAAISAYYTERFAELEAAGVDFRAVRAEVRRLAEAEDAANGTAYAESILTPEGE